ncbi:MAG: hypothetical protein ACO377_14640, partial [Pseudomonadales bacterium]
MSMKLRSPALFRPRRVWLPTVWGWVVLLALSVLVGIVAVRGLGNFLGVTATAPGAQILVVEGWVGESALEVALARVRAGGYRHVVTSGGPITQWPGPWSNYAARAGDYLAARGLPRSVTLHVLPAPATAQDRTYASAVWVRDGLAAAGVPVIALDVLSGGAHARRTRTLYELAFGADVPVGIIAVVEPGPDGVYLPWWRTSDGVKQTIMEFMSYVWTQCCFWPPPPGSHEERWAVPRQ